MLTAGLVPVVGYAALPADEFSMSRQALIDAGYRCSRATGPVNILFSEVCRHPTKKGIEYGRRATRYEVSVGKSGRVDAVGAEVQIDSVHDLAALMIDVPLTYPYLSMGQPFVIAGLRSELWCDRDGGAAKIGLIPSISPALQPDTYSLTYYRPGVIARCAKSERVN